jgi:hypothetical protein
MVMQCYSVLLQLCVCGTVAHVFVHPWCAHEHDIVHMHMLMLTTMCISMHIHCCRWLAKPLCVVERCMFHPMPAKRHFAVQTHTHTHTHCVCIDCLLAFKASILCLMNSQYNHCVDTHPSWMPAVKLPCQADMLLKSTKYVMPAYLHPAC